MGDVIRMMALTTAVIMIIFSPTFLAVPTPIAAKGMAHQAAAVAVAEPETFSIIPSSANAANWNVFLSTGDGEN